MSSQENNHNPPIAESLDARFRRPLLSFFLRRVGDRNEAEDLTQEVLLRVVQAGRQSRIEHAPAYIFKIAVNLLRDRQRRAATRGPGLFVPLDDVLAGELKNELALDDSSPERVLLSESALADVLRALDELGEQTRNIFILFRIENMKQKDIAALYGIGQSTVEKHVMKAVLHLAKRFGRS